MLACTTARVILSTWSAPVEAFWDLYGDLFDDKSRGGFHSDSRCVAGMITRPSQADQGYQSPLIRQVYQVEDLRRQCIDRPFQGLRRMSPWL